MVLGRPRLFFAVSAGAMDSLVAHYTPQRKLRRDDAYTPGGRHGARPNRATIVYTSCCKAAYRDAPVVIGGIEASLRRFAHYDFWEDAVRRSVLFDAKADLLVYGMGERPLLELARRLRAGEPFGEIRDIRGTAFAARDVPATAVELPSFEEVAADRQKFASAYRLSAAEQNPAHGRALMQRHGDRWLVCNPPSLPLAESELDAVYALPFSRLPHPSCREPIPAWEQIKTSVTTHRGCAGGCAFCAIGQHQGKLVQSRSAGSILREVEWLAEQPWFRGSISDLGGPTANMYGLTCGKVAAREACRRESCLFPRLCPHLAVADDRAAELRRVAAQRVEPGAVGLELELVLGDVGATHGEVEPTPRRGAEVQRGLPVDTRGLGVAQVGEGVHHVRQRVAARGLAGADGVGRHPTDDFEGMGAQAEGDEEESEEQGEASHGGIGSPAS